MNEILTILLRIAGVGLIALSVLHIPIGKSLKWKEDAAQLSMMNESVFHVHTFFVCLVLVMMGLPAVVDPPVYLAPTRAGAWLTWSIAIFWAARLYCQWFVYRADLWRGKRMEFRVHWLFTFIWISLTALFAACGFVQVGWLR